MYLKWNEVEDLVPELPGTNRGYHCKQGKGNDKLYVTLEHDGSILGYCHHCGSRGRFNLSRSSGMGSRDLAVQPSHGVAKQVTYPFDMIEDYAKFPKKLQDWLSKYDIHPAEAMAFGIGFSPSKDRVVLPVNETAFVLRDLDGREPKTINVADKTKPFIYSSLDKPEDGRMVLVEDFLSLIRVNRVTNGTCMFGTNVNEEKIRGIDNPNVKTYLLFFDNDNHQVKSRQLEAMKLIEVLTGKPCRVILSDRDPKAHTDRELRELLE